MTCKPYSMCLALLMSGSTILAQDPFYERPALFSTRPQAVREFTQSVDRFGPVGIGIELLQPAFGMKVMNVEPGSPAAATGKVRAGQLIASINGETLKGIDPRIQLGRIITAAEASDGKVVLALQDDASAPIENVTVTIPVLGAYSATWPLDCPKSDSIVRAVAERFAQAGHSGDIGLDGPKMLFMLSTGEDADLEVVRTWVQKVIAKNAAYGERGLTYQWHISWGAPPLAEYYLRTGDASVLPLLQRIADAVVKTQYQGGWGGRGLAGHHMGLAGTGTLTFLMLAKQCGVDVDEDMLQSALAHYYRFAGRGTNPYMDHPPESTFTDNGRNGRLAFAMAAASRLRPEGEASLYAQARDINAMKSFYSSSYMLHGHTGGGIGEVWRSASMGLLAEKRPEHYREFMTQRTWFYDLSRRYTGSFGILGGGDRYDNEQWGAAMGLTYTAPRKQLCIFGAPHSPHAKTNDAIPYRAWGNASDDAFFSIETPAGTDGTVRDLSGERVATDTGVAVDRLMGQATVTDAQILSFIYHPEHRFREVAANAIRKHGRYHLIPDLLQSSDPRVRGAGVMACSASLFGGEETVAGFDRDAVLARLLEMLTDPEEAWFTVYAILNVVPGAPAERLEPVVDGIADLLGHEEWWLRHRALEALVPLAADAKTAKTVLPAIEAHLPNFIRWNWQFSKRTAIFKDADPELRQAFLDTLGRVYVAYPGPKAVDPAGGLHPDSEKKFVDALAYTIAGIPGGLETLYEVSQKRFPNATLAHRDQFLSRATSTPPSEKLQVAINSIVVTDLIPQHVRSNWRTLKAFAAGESGNASSMRALQNLYRKVGVKDYDWTPYGLSPNDATWSYHSFDPPEIWEGTSDRLGRYRDVTLPEGMGDWFAPDFDAKAQGWTRGQAPFGAANGKKAYNTGATTICGMSFCRCGEPINTLWEKDVILLHGTFEVPPMEEGYSYRLLHGGISHVGSGGGYRLYVNGKLFVEDKRGVDRRAGGNPEGRVITKEWWPDFADGSVTLAAISFKKHHPRTKRYGGSINIFMERMKSPPLEASTLLTAVAQAPLLSSDWQALQDPTRNVDDPEEGKFNWDGTFAENAALAGEWVQLGAVASVADFVPTVKRKASSRLPKTLALRARGETDAPLLYYTGSTLLNLERNEALKMSVLETDGTSYLFIEEGGFSPKHPAGWTGPLVAYKRR